MPYTILHSGCVLMPSRKRIRADRMTKRYETSSRDLTQVHTPQEFDGGYEDEMGDTKSNRN